LDIVGESIFSQKVCRALYLIDDIWTLMFDVIFHFKLNNVEILDPNLDILYFLYSKLFDTFDKNKNTKESLRNLQKCSIRTSFGFE
jgi:hypothetical protein